MVEPTRIDSTELEVAVSRALKKIEEATELLAPYLVLLTDKERESMPRAHQEFERVGRALVQSIAQHPEVALVAGFDAEAVLEDLDNLQVLGPLLQKVEQLHQRLADSHLTWTAEAWVPSLTAYGVAKAASKTDPTLRAVVEANSEVFSMRRAQPQPAGKK